MAYHVLSPDTQAILLLCASFGQSRMSQPQPLTLSEYNSLAGWLVENQMSPKDLLDPTFKNRSAKITIAKLDFNRIGALLERGVMLGLAVEKWTNQGLWILGRGDSLYPKRLKQRLKHLAPAILYGVGNPELLTGGELAVVGSRDIDEAGLSYTCRVAEICAEQGMTLISGGARGIDRTAMVAVLEAGGTSVGVLADSLTKASVDGKYRAGIKEGRLTLVSSYDPSAGFSVGNAMGRNKYIYALADHALVISCSFGKGGTWAGATEALERMKDVSVFVRMQGTIPEGNLQLLKKGAKLFPEEPWKNSLRTLLATSALEVEPKTKVAKTDSETKDIVVDEPSSGSFADIVPQTHQFPPKDIYEAVLPFILSHLEQPKDTKSLAQSLDIRQTQMQDWLNRAVIEGKVKKIKKPVAYVVNQKPALLSLLNEG